jgi:hypothetical protein
LVTELVTESAKGSELEQQRLGQRRAPK